MIILKAVLTRREAKEHEAMIYHKKSTGELSELLRAPERRLREFLKNGLEHIKIL